MVSDEAVVSWHETVSSFHAKMALNILSKTKIDLETVLQQNPSI